MTHKKLKKAAKQCLAKAFKKSGDIPAHVIQAAVAVALSYKVK